MDHDVFISYSAEDRNVAEEVGAILERRKISCWITPRDTPAGIPYGEAIITGLNRTRLLVLIFSSHSNNSPQVMREVERAIDKGIPVIPLRIEKVTPSGAMEYYLSTPHWMDAFTEPLEEHIQKLADSILILLEEVRETPSQPVKNTLATTQKPKILDTLQVNGAANRGDIQFCVGDVTNLDPDDAVDVLVISSFPDHYFNAPGSVIGALLQRGISVPDLANNKEVDLRQAFSCWISREIINPPPGIHFKRILCYEPPDHAKAGELVGDIFRSLAPFLGGPIPIRTVATPLIASGFQRADPAHILQLLVDAAVHWMLTGLPLSCLKIVCTPDKNIAALSRLFFQLKEHHSKAALRQGYRFSHDVFISYAHRDTREVKWFEKALRKRRSDLRVFVDQRNLKPGAAWQREIFEMLDKCRKVATFYSPSYLDSKVCLEEFNIALCRNRDSDEPILIPIYLYTANLPTYMRVIQLFDCREFNKEKLNQAADQIVSSIHKG